MMKRLIALMLTLGGLLSSYGQTVSFQIQDGLNNSEIKEAAEKNISLLLTEINSACSENRPLQLDSIPMTKDARRLLEGLWSHYAHFSCIFGQNISRCLNSTRNYQIREIYVTMHPIEGVSFVDEKERELVVCFSNEGILVSVYIGLEGSLLNEAISRNSDVTDAGRKLSIIQFLERYINYCYSKDVESMADLYVPDGLHVYRDSIGRYVNPQRSKISEERKEYFEVVKQQFCQQGSIHIFFDELEIMRHIAKGNWYGVHICQHLVSPSFEDAHYLFLLWQFTSEDEFVHEIVWQPGIDDGKPIDKEDRVGISDFFIE